MDDATTVIVAAAVSAAVVLPVVPAALMLRRAEPGRASRVLDVAMRVVGVAALVALVVTATTDDAVSVGFGLGLDRATAPILALVAVTGLVVAAFARRGLDADPRQDRFAALTGVLLAGTVLTVAADALIPFVLGWLVSSRALIALVAHREGWRQARRAQSWVRRRLAIGDLVLVVTVGVLVALDGLDASAGSAADRIEGRTWLGLPAVDVIAVLLVVAAASRSSLFPFHRWLVRTIVAPTPVSAVVHAGFIGGAGVALVVLGPLLTSSTIAMHLLFALGLVTVVIASAASTLRADIKGLLAWSTVAQMGFMAVQGAVGALSSVVAHLLGHGMYKAALFLGAGGTVSSEVADRRRPRREPMRLAAPLSAVLAVASVGVGILVLPPDLDDAGTALVAFFAAMTAAHAAYGWMRTRPLGTAASVMAAAVATPAAVFAYLGGLRLVEALVAPAVKSIDLSGAVSLGATIVGLALAGLAWAAIVLVPGSSPLGRTIRARLIAAAEPVDGTPRRAEASVDSASTAPPVVAARRRAEASGDLARALDIVAPQWPLATFVAVNPLGGLEHLGFAEAGAAARRWLHVRTEQPLDDLRDAHRHGFSDAASVRTALWTRLAHLDPSATIDLDGRTVTIEQVLLADLFHGPEPVNPVEPRTALEAADRSDGGERSDVVDAIIGATLARHVGSHGGSSTSAWSAWRSTAATDPRVAVLAGPAGHRWLASLPEEPLDALVVALDACGVPDDECVAALRGHLARLRGWAGLAVWRTEWADDDDPHPRLAPVEVVAMRVSLEAAVVVGGRAAPFALDPSPGAATVGSADGVVSVGSADGTPVPASDRRVDAALDALGVGASVASTGARSVVADVLGELIDDERPAVFREAQEFTFDERLLTSIDRPRSDDAEAVPEAQLVFCIDVRSERLRRHLEAVGPWKTLGFAGFFGLPVRVARAGWTRPEASCPVLVRPAGTVVEDDEDPVAAASIADAVRIGGLDDAWHSAKHGAGGAFALAEASGFVTGPAMVKRTLRPARHQAPSRPAVPLRFGGDDIVGLALEQRVYFAQAILTTMGLTSGFAPVVVLCGHGSETTNNPHASALDCGACGGNPGDLNARAVAALLNDTDVRDGLTAHGIEIPATTWFLGALHETVSDHVELLDTDAVPSSHRSSIERLRHDLAVAGSATATERSALLPGVADRVRDRGRDWAQVRPEWGLAGNAAFVIAPRALTEGVDLGGRVFLHSYDAAEDPEGRVLETIMTAPVVVAHWISSQYYFSSVDPDAFGAGDKMLHNPVGSAGVLLGDGGDLRVGLPWQSTHVGERRFHQPLRLLVAIEAPFARIEEIIGRNNILQTLVGGGWIRLAARQHPTEGWSTRSATGTWTGRLRTLPIDWSLPDAANAGERMMTP